MNQYTPAYMGGRCANGYERDRGTRVHALTRSAEEIMDAYCMDKAVCGAKPGSRSVGWCYYPRLSINCPRCMKRTGEHHESV